ncbi:hypothetical protein BH20PSE1_BH20PSE1_17600 [soil metagenome]
MIEFGFTELGLQQIFGSTISANARVKRLAIWFGATEIMRGPGPAWMQERGWHQTEWQITRETCERNARVRTHELVVSRS